MAINKNNYLDANGDYDLKKALVDEIIDGANKGDKLSQIVKVNDGGTGVAIGKVSESDSFEVALNSNFINTANFDNALTVKKKIDLIINQAINLNYVTAIDNDGNAWNTPDYKHLWLENGNNALNIMVDGTFNSRTAWIQVGHRFQEYAGSLGTLKLNPLGGNVTINGNTAWHSGNLSGSSRKTKKDIDNTNHQENFDIFKRLKVYDYNLKDEFDEKKTREKDHIGLMTDEVPNFLTDKDQSYIKLYDLLSLTVSTLQTTIKKVETLGLKVKDLENEIEKLKGGNQ